MCCTLCTVYAGTSLHVVWQQGVLADFESIMKRAHTKEAASLPRQPAHVAIDIQATGGHHGYILHTECFCVRVSLQTG